jgi:uncharacterized protein DUF3105
MARRQRTRRLGISLIAVAAVLIVVLVVIVQPGGSSLPSPDALLARARTATQQAGCTDVETIGYYDGVSDTSSPDYVDETHIGASAAFPTAPALRTYPSIPPTSGPHAPIPPGALPAGVYDAPPDIYRAIHSLEHGATIIWYRPGTSGATLEELKSFYGQSGSAVGQDRVIVAPYGYPDDGAAGSLPQGVNMAIAAWHRLQTCSSFSLPVAFDFTSQYSAPPFGDRQYRGEAPEAGAAL